MNVERKLLWWKFVESEEPQLFGWNFLLINEEREAKAIYDKICDELEVVEERKEIDSGAIPNSGAIHYDLFTLYSPKVCIDFSKIYEGCVKKDRRLQRRYSKEGWNQFIDLVVSGAV